MSTATAETVSPQAENLRAQNERVASASISHQSTPIENGSQLVSEVIEPDFLREAAEKDLAAMAAREAERKRTERLKEYGITDCPPHLMVLALAHCWQATQHLRQNAASYEFAARGLERFRYVEGLGWHCWSGTHWEVDEGDARALGAVLETLRALHKVGEMREVRLPGVKEPVLKFVSRYEDYGLGNDESTAARRSILDGASIHKGIFTSYRDLDADPYLLNCSNGTLDLRTLELRPHDPADLITKSTGTPYVPGTTSELWESFLETSLPDPEVRGFVQRAAGLALIGEQVEHSMLVHHGQGRNGKGVFYQAKGHALGDYFHHASSDLFDFTPNSDANSAKPAMLELMAKRYVTLSETGKNVRIDTARLKALTGGDPITGRNLYSKTSVTFEPSHSIELISNYLPRLPDDDPAVWARVVAVPWDVVIPKEDQDPGLPKKLRGEAPAILAWMVEGLRDYQARGGLDAPAAVQAKTDAYREEQNVVVRFLEEMCDDDVTKQADMTPHAQLFEGFKDWCQREGVYRAQRLSGKDFVAALGRLGYVGKHTNRGNVYGIKLVAPDAEKQASGSGYEAAVERATQPAPQPARELTKEEQKAKAIADMERQLAALDD